MKCLLKLSGPWSAGCLFTTWLSAAWDERNCRWDELFACGDPFRLVFQVSCVAGEHRAEIRQGPPYQRQHQTRKTLLHDEIGRAVIPRLQFERADAFE